MSTTSSCGDTAVNRSGSSCVPVVVHWRMLPLLRLSAHPRIVNQSSHVGSLTLQTAPGVDLGGISGAYAPSKTFLNALTVQYAKELADTSILA